VGGQTDKDMLIAILCTTPACKQGDV